MKKLLFANLTICAIAFPFSIYTQNVSGAIASVSVITGTCYFIKRKNDEEELEAHGRKPGMKESDLEDPLEAKFKQMWKEAFEEQDRKRLTATTNINKGARK
jgi:hypothetical protein